jgi:hypothetical protein
MLRADADADGVISPAERRTLTDGLESGKVPVTLREGGSAHWVELNLQRLGLDAPKQTGYDWLSSDGYPLIRTVKPNPKDTFVQHCTLDIEECLPSSLSSSLEVFRRVAFEKPDCGDCLIVHLIGRSGPVGLGAFLPPPKAPRASPPQTPRLEKTWQDATFFSGMGREYAVNIMWVSSLSWPQMTTLTFLFSDSGIPMSLVKTLHSAWKIGTDVASFIHRKFAHGVPVAASGMGHQAVAERDQRRRVFRGQ